MGARIRGLAVIVLVLVTGAVLGTWIAQWLQAPAVTRNSVTVPIPSVFGERVTVEVRNGGGRSGMAREATRILRDRGYDVVEVGNWTDFSVDSSRVVARVSGGSAAAEVAAALGIAAVDEEPAPNLRLDVTVVLGREWTPEMAPPPPEPGDAVPWWDLRRYLERPGAPDGGARLADPENESR